LHVAQQIQDAHETAFVCHPFFGSGIEDMLGDDSISGGFDAI
jgi:hypothetical protein